MVTGSIARRYAKALFAIGEEKGDLLGLLRDVQSMAAVWSENEELRDTVQNPLVAAGVKREIWDGIIKRLGISMIVKSFLSLLFDKSRLVELPGIAREIGALTDRKENRLRAEVTSASPLPDDVAQRLKAALQRSTGKMIVVTKTEDPGLIGGIVTRVGDLMYDGSLKTQFKRMKETMLGRS
jgi:F-type H+-transporting ATPase subunit delta